MFSTRVPEIMEPRKLLIGSIDDGPIGNLMENTSVENNDIIVFRTKTLHTSDEVWMISFYSGTFGREKILMDWYSCWTSFCYNMMPNFFQCGRKVHGDTVVGDPVSLRKINICIILKIFLCFSHISSSCLILTFCLITSLLQQYLKLSIFQKMIIFIIIGAQFWLSFTPVAPFSVAILLLFAELQ